MRAVRFRAVCLLLTFCFLLLPVSQPAEAGSFFTPRRTFGVLFLGGSMFMAKKSLDFHNDANDIFEAYKLAGNSNDADVLYDRASDRDTKSQMSLGLSLVLLAGGLRLLISSGVDDNVPKHDKKLRLEVTQDYKVRIRGCRFP